MRQKTQQQQNQAKSQNQAKPNLAQHHNIESVTASTSSTSSTSSALNSKYNNSIDNTKDPNSRTNLTARINNCNQFTSNMRRRPVEHYDMIGKVLHYIDFLYELPHLFHFNRCVLRVANAENLKEIERKTNYAINQDRCGKSNGRCHTDVVRGVIYHKNRVVCCSLMPFIILPFQLYVYFRKHK